MHFVYEHPASGVLLHVEYKPATDTAAMELNDVHVAGPDYKPVGQSLALFLHETYTMDMSTTPAMATSVLQRIAEEISCQLKK